MRTSRYLHGLLILSACAFESQVNAQQYDVTDLGSADHAPVISNNGTVAGTSANSAWMWQSGTRTYLGSLGGGTSFATAIGATGEIVGYSYTGSNLDAFSYSSGTLTDLGRLPGGYASYAEGVNSTGTVVGFSYVGGSGSTISAVEWNGSTITNIGAGTSFGAADGINELGTIVGGGFEYSSSMGLHSLTSPPGPLAGISANAINNNGIVVGYSEDFSYISAIHAVIWDNGQITDIGVLGKDGNGVQSVSSDINSFNQVVGSSTTGKGEHAFLYESGAGIEDLNSLIETNSGWVLTDASSINDSGEIVGLGTLDGLESAFLLTPIPVPEPNAIMTVIFAILLLVFKARQREPKRR